ncbi:SUKH-4 family immunity protein [Nocardia crassostreae]|uniref:SUKH-4 family immunity protein n=1 Tax=Nocardia crassostreae TaxID=53428 RepID=UPI001470F7C3|nr:SUKH-4 family immunity protein [Nocardia crassostreae]
MEDEMVSAEEYQRAWESWGGSLSIPIDAWKSIFEAPEDSYPSVDSLPVSLSFLYRAFSERIDMYSRVDLRYHPEDEDGIIPTVLLGTVPDEDDILYLFDTRSGSVIQIDLQDGIPETINSSLRAFVEFLYHFAIFAYADQGAEGRSDRARELRSVLTRIDPSAFLEADSWWSTTFRGLESA